MEYEKERGKQKVEKKLDEVKMNPQPLGARIRGITVIGDPAFRKLCGFY